MELKKDLKIELFPNNKPVCEFQKEPIKDQIKNYLIHSLDQTKNLAYFYSNAPILYGYYEAHCHHHPIRIKPDDIWLLIIQSFSHHVNANYGELKKFFVDFDNRKDIKIDMDYQKIEENFVENCVQKITEEMSKYLGSEILEILNPDFTTINTSMKLVCKMTMISTFEKFFNFNINMNVCGIPYIILEGDSDDYKKIISKSEKLKKYNFEWYIDRIIPLIQKLVDAKEGKIDVNFFKNIVIKSETDEEVAVDCKLRKRHVIKISGWILKFFAYKKEEEDYFIFEEDELDIEDFDKIASQILHAPFTIIKKGKKSKMAFDVGFFGCEQNEKNEISPVIGWGMTKKINFNN